MRIIIMLAVLVSMGMSTSAEAGVFGVIDRIIAHERRDAVQDYRAAQKKNYVVKHAPTRNHYVVKHVPHKNKTKVTVVKHVPQKNKPKVTVVKHVVHKTPKPVPHGRNHVYGYGR